MHHRLSLNHADPLPELGSKVEEVPPRVLAEVRETVTRINAYLDFEEGGHGAAQGITEASCRQHKAPWPFPSYYVVESLICDGFTITSPYSGHVWVIS